MTTIQSKRSPESWLRRMFMRSTSLSIRFGSSAWYVRLLYRLWAAVYDRSIAWDPAYRANARRMIEAVVGDGDHVLDVGVGTGLLAEYGARKASSYQGIDYSGPMLAQAARKVATLGLANVSLQWGDARKLPQADGRLDVVVSSFALPHFADQEKVDVLREMARVLKPGGQIGLFLAQGEVAPLFSTKIELEAMLRQAGLTDVAIEDHDDVYRVATCRKPVPV